MSIHTLPSYNEDSLADFLAEIEEVVVLSDKEKEKIRLVYSFADLLHHDEVRKDGTHYFEHPKEVARNLLKITNPTADQIIDALLHDLIENTAVEYYLLKHLFGIQRANSIKSISKKCWTLYLKDIPKEALKADEIAKIESLRGNDPIHQILTPEQIGDDEINLVFSGKNFSDKKDKIKRLLSLLIQQVQKNGRKVFDIIIIDAQNAQRQEIAEFIANCFSETQFEFKLTFHSYVNRDSLPTYRDFPDSVKNLARQQRDIDYFQSMEDLPDEVLDVKFADRIHNLETISGLSLQKKEKLYHETVRYFLDLAKKRNSRAWNILRGLCTKLAREISNAKIVETL